MLRLGGIVGVHRQRDGAGGGLVGGIHLQPVLPAAIQVDLRPLNVAIGAGRDGHPRPFQGADVAPLGDAARGHARIVRIVILDLLHEDSRGDLHLDVERPGGAIAGDQVIAHVLLQAQVPRRQRALVAVGLGDERERNGLIDALAVGRRVKQRHGLPRAGPRRSAEISSVSPWKATVSPGRTSLIVTRVGAATLDQGQRMRPMEIRGFFGEKNR